MIPLRNCIKGHIYKIRARNFQYGINDGHGGFIGARKKWNDRYYFTEYHKEIGGTVEVVEDTGIIVPKKINLKNLDSKKLTNFINSTDLVKKF